MGSFHRLTTPSYLGGLPGTHDYINNTPGDPSQAPADGAKSGGPNAGTLFVAFGEDATSSNTNRANKALGQNADFIDDVISGEVPVPTELTVTAPGGAVSSYQITDSVFVGISGVYLDTSEWRDKLVRVVDPTTGNEILGSSGLPVRALSIKDSTNTSNVVGTESSGFYSNPYVNFTPQIPSGQDFKLIYGKRSSLVKVIKDKTNLDAFTRVALPGAPQVVGEVERFMHEAARRSGSIQALAASIFETPGQGDNIGAESSSMYLDIDPKGTYSATARSLLVRGGRDATPDQLFNVGVNLIPAGAKVRTPDHPMLLGDSYTTKYQPLSDSSNTEHKLLDKTYLGIGAANPSLVAQANRKWTVTVGDGTNSFGDFNSIEDAVDYFKTHYIHVTNYGHGITIQLKPGVHAISDYVFSFAVSGVYFTDLTIIGASKESCIIETGGSTAGIICRDSGTLRLQNVTVRAGAQKVGIRLEDDARVVLSECSFYRAGIYALMGTDNSSPTYARLGSPSFYAERCVFDVSNADMSVLDLNVSEGADVRGFIFVDCYMQGDLDYPVVKISDYGAMATAAVLRDVHFIRCDIWTGGSTATTAGVPMGGALFLNPSANNMLTITDITFEDTDVTGPAISGLPGVASSSTLLWFRPRFSSSVRMIVEKLRIIGGKWTVGYGGNALLPFYIGSQDGGISYDPPKRVWLEDLRLVWDTTVSLDYGDHPTVLSAIGAKANGAAFYVLADSLLSVRNVSLANPTSQSGCGDFYFGSGSLLVSFLRIGRGDWKCTASHGIPEYRVKLYGGGLVQRLHVDGQSCSDQASSVGMVTISTPTNLTLAYCSVQTFTGASGETAFRPLWESGGSTWYLRMLYCFGTSCYRGFYLTQDGSSAADIEELTVVGCDFFGNSYAGFGIVGAKSPNAYSIQRLDISHNNVNENDVHGMVIAPGAFRDSDSQVIAHNKLYNNGSVTGQQIRLGNTSAEAYGEDCYATVIGNNCGGSGVTHGNITITQQTGSPHTPYSRGTETKDITNAAHTDMATWWGHGENMLHNRAELALVSV